MNNNADNLNMVKKQGGVLTIVKPLASLVLSSLIVVPSLVVASCSSDEPELAPPFNTRGGLTADSTAADSARMQGDITIDSTWAGETVINFDFGPDADSPDFHTDSIRTGGNAGDAV